MPYATPFVLTFVSHDPTAVGEAGRRVMASGAPINGIKRLGPQAMDLEVPEAFAHGVAEAVSGLPVDYCLQPSAQRRKRLFVADMDSTIVACECLDELADFAGVKAEVAAVTERAMRGEIGFETALRERVARLKGLPVSTISDCLRERVRLNPGAGTLLRTLRAHGVRTVLVSGGFEAFAAPVAEMAGFEHHLANRLLVEDGRLTGEVGDPILGAEGKLAALQLHAEQAKVVPVQTLAVGDGANDLKMIQAAGLGVAYRAKPVVAAEARARIEHTDLTALLYFQGYHAREFVEPVAAL